MKWTTSASFIRVGHFYTFNCLNLPGLRLRSSRLIKARLTTSAVQVAGRWLDRRHWWCNRLLTPKTIARNCDVNWSNFRLSVKAGVDVNGFKLLVDRLAIRQCICDVFNTSWCPQLRPRGFLVFECFALVELVGNVDFSGIKNCLSFLKL